MFVGRPETHNIILYILRSCNLVNNILKYNTTSDKPRTTFVVACIRRHQHRMASKFKGLECVAVGISNGSKGGRWVN